MKWGGALLMSVLVWTPTASHVPPEEWGGKLDGKPFREIMGVYGYTDSTGTSEWDKVLEHRF